jgi:glycogen phosphorylase
VRAISVIDFIASGALGHGDAELFRPIVENLLDHDPFLLLADYQAYIDAQDRVSALWDDAQAWTRQSILNSARMRKFSSDRSIRDYCERVWKVQPGPVNPWARGNESTTTKSPHQQTDHEQYHHC